MGKISPSELSIMTYIWNEEAAGHKGKPFRDILSYVGDGVAKQTVNTYLSRLISKGYVNAEGSRGSKVYTSLVSRREYGWILLMELYKSDKESILTDLMKFGVE